MALAANPKSRKSAIGDLPPLKVAKEFMQADKSNKSYNTKVKVRPKPKQRKEYGGKTSRLRGTKAKNTR
jgi:hypothetical protein